MIDRFFRFFYLFFVVTLSLFTSSSAHSQTFKPRTVPEIEQIVKDTLTQQGHITVMGAGKAVSGKTTLKNTTHINLKNLKKHLDFNVANKTITVQAGITWKEIQDVINPHGLSVAAMQSYNDFSVGGSIGVNAHGQDFRFAPVGSTIISMIMVNAQGEKVTLSPQQNPQLYHAIIGGYGLFGIITEVTLQLIDNTLLKKRVKLVRTNKLDSLIKKTLATKNIALFSGRFTIGKDDFFKDVLALTYYDTPKISTATLHTLSPLKNFMSQQSFAAMRKHPEVKNARLFVEKNLLEKNMTQSRNAAMYNSIDHLQESRHNHIDILQEYFIPLKNVNLFVQKAKIILQKHKVNLLNCTLRFVKQDATSFLSYAPETSGALVLYITLPHNVTAFAKAERWTRELINAALECQGTFYLPYQCFATKEQVRAAYPQFDEFIKLKQQYDPQEIFVNDLYLTYK